MGGHFSLRLVLAKQIAASLRFLGGSVRIYKAGTRRRATAPLESLCLPAPMGFNDTPRSCRAFPPPQILSKDTYCHGHRRRCWGMGGG